MFSIKESSRSCLRKLFCLSGLLLALQLSSCEKDEVLNEPVQEQKTGKSEIRLGAKVESPFLLRNMQRSVDSLSARSGLKSLTILKPTHLYVRFLPADTTQYERLVADTTLDFDSYPLDYELTEGDSYHDPSLPADAITWQYTVVPADYDLKGLGITYEVLDELYILDEDLEREDISVGDTQLRSGKGSGLSWKSVVDEALIQTGNVGETTLRSKWTPAATIKAYDDLMGKYIPLQGVKVRIRYFAFLKAYHYTDANGNVTFSSKRTSVEYSIEWECEKWDIRYKFTQAYSNGPDQKSRWNLNINTSNMTRLHLASIHRALYKYYYGDACGLIRPNEHLKLFYNDWDEEAPNGTTYYVNIEFFKDILSSIKIYGLESEGVYKPASKVLSTTLHELTHASHCLYVGFTNYVQTDLIIREALALAGQWVLTKDEYKTINRNMNTQYDYLLSRIECQDWPYILDNRNFTRSKEYSPLMIDMLDDSDQSSEGKPIIDKVSGFYLYYFERSMHEIKSVSDFKDFVLHCSPGDVNVANYFRQFDNYNK